MNCSQTRELIDEKMSPGLREADDMGWLSGDATGHIASCAECRTFSEQRIKLRQLIWTLDRVGAPSNFEMLLKARLARRAVPERSGWLAPAFSFRFAGAAALILCAILVGYFSAGHKGGTTLNPSSTGIATNIPLPPVPPRVTKPLVPSAVPTPETARTVRENSLAVPVRSRRPARRDQATTAMSDLQLAYATAYANRDSMSLLLRAKDKAGEREVRVSAVSLGAEPLFEVTRQSEPARIVRTSF